MNEYGYNINIINEKMISICDNNFSDDELTYLTYLLFIYIIDKQEQSNSILNDLTSYLVTGLQLSHNYKYLEKSPF